MEAYTDFFTSNDIPLPTNDSVNSDPTEIKYFYGASSVEEIAMGETGGRCHKPFGNGVEREERDGTECTTAGDCCGYAEGLVDEIKVRVESC